MQKKTLWKWWTTRYFQASQVTQWVKRLSAMQEIHVRSLDWEHPLEEEMATHPSILPWRMPWTKKPGRLQSIGLQRVRHDWSEHACTHQVLSGYRITLTSLNQFICHMPSFYSGESIFSTHPPPNFSLKMWVYTQNYIHKSCIYHTHTHTHNGRHRRGDRERKRQGNPPWDSLAINLAPERVRKQVLLR